MNRCMSETHMGMKFIHIFLPEELCAPILLQLIAVAMTLLGMPVLRDCISHHAHMVITHVISMPVGNHKLRACAHKDHFT